MYPNKHTRDSQNAKDDSARNEFFNKFHKLTATPSNPRNTAVNDSSSNVRNHNTNNNRNNSISSGIGNGTSHNPNQNLITQANSSQVRDAIWSIRAKKRNTSTIPEPLGDNSLARMTSNIHVTRKPKFQLEKNPTATFLQKELVQSPISYIQTPSSGTSSGGYFQRDTNMQFPTNNTQHKKNFSSMSIDTSFSSSLDVSRKLDLITPTTSVNSASSNPNINQSNIQRDIWRPQIETPVDHDHNIIMSFNKPLDSIDTSTMTDRNSEPSNYKPAQWKGMLYGGKHENFVASVSVQPLDERHVDVGLFQILLEGFKNIKIQSIIPLNYMLELMKLDKKNTPENHSKYPVSTLSSLDNKERLDKISKSLKWSEYVGLILLNNKIIIFLCPTSTRTCYELRIQRPENFFVMFHLPLDRFPSAPMIPPVDLGDNNWINSDLRVLEKFNAEIMARLIKLPKNLRELFSNIRFTVFGDKNLNYFEVNDMICLLKSLQSHFVPSEELQESDFKTLDVVLVHRSYLSQMSMIPAIADLKRQGRVRFFGFGSDIRFRSIIPKPKEIYPSGGIFTVTSAGLLFEDKVVEQLITFMQNAQGNSTRGIKRKWRFKIHQDIYRFMKECADNSTNEIIRARAMETWKQFARLLSSGMIEYMLPMEVHEPVFDISNDEILHWSMLKMNSLYYKKYRHFVLIDIVHSLKINHPGIEIMSLDDFKRTFVE
ncbi:hypothetical protein G9A89_011060 [Geosiphon pyriformis]|nr:hypothetical protein G9A89_011060 [Geosiphon pyriformis]